MDKVYAELIKKKDDLYLLYYFNIEVDFTKIRDLRARNIEYSFKRIFEYMNCENIDIKLVEKELETIKINLEMLIREYC